MHNIDFMFNVFREILYLLPTLKCELGIIILSDRKQ